MPDFMATLFTIDLILSFIVMIAVFYSMFTKEKRSTPPQNHEVDEEESEKDEGSDLPQLTGQIITCSEKAAKRQESKKGKE